MKGSYWGRQDDTLGLAGVINSLSGDARRYLAAGGIGILIGDGALSYGLEQTIETYYDVRITEGVTLGADFQYIQNPGYNQVRGPISVFGGRLHAEF